MYSLRLFFFKYLYFTRECRAHRLYCPKLVALLNKATVPCFQISVYPFESSCLLEFVGSLSSGFDNGYRPQ